MEKVGGPVAVVLLQPKLDFSKVAGSFRTADLWLPVRPGTDIALLNGMLRQIIQDGRIDEAYIRDRTVGWEEIRAEVASYTPEFVERIAGVPAARVVEAAQMYAQFSPSLIMHARGIEHSTHGVDNCLACCVDWISAHGHSAIQLWILTLMLDLILEGRTERLFELVLISGVIFLGGILVLWLLRRQPGHPFEL